MALTFRSKKTISAAATLAMFSMMTGMLAYPGDKPSAASANKPAIATRSVTRPLVSVPPGPATVGEIEIPAAGLATRVLEGDDARILRLGVGHIPGTAVPGPSGNVGLAAHRNTFFRGLRKVQVGDEIKFVTKVGTFRYRVVSLRVVLPSAVEVLAPTQQPTLTLVTCFPFDYVGDAPERLIVHAGMVAASPD
jgi:sortase A